MKGGSFDSLELPAKDADTMVIGLHDLNGEAVVAVGLLDVDNHTWLLHFADRKGCEEIMNSLRKHMDDL